jgi:hypothetical protein
MRKHVDSIDMNTGKPAFDNEDKVEMADAPKFETTATEKSVNPKETFEHEGVKIYEKTTATGDVIYYDVNGNEVSSRVVDILFTQYPAAPEFNQQGGEKDGEMIVTNAEYKVHGKEKFEDGKKPEYVVERQNYTVGDPHMATIPKEHYQLVKFLRGELQPNAAIAAKEGENIGKEKESGTDKVK